MRTASLQARIVAGMLLLLAVTLTAVALITTSLFTRQASANLETILDGRMQLARQLARTDVAPGPLVQRVQTEGVNAWLVLKDGREFGTAPEPGPKIRIIRATLTGGKVDGARLTLSVDQDLVTDSRDTLVRILAVTAAAVLAVGGLLTFVITRVALAPLRTVAAMAHRIAGGERGTRLRPTRPDTELGQTAHAIDAMLDELEGAEGRARDAEAGARREQELTQRFLADAAHELRTPLAGVALAAETLLHADLSQQERQELEALLARESTRAGALVSDLLDAARLDAGTPLSYDAVDLQALAEGEVARVRLARPGVRADVRAAAPAPPDAPPDAPLAVWADPGALTSILRNLIDNAARAAAPDGWVQVGIGPAEDPAYVLLTVTDSGRGIAPADRERIFDRLVRLDPGPGSGLGLPIARGYARAMGGEVRCIGSEAIRVDATAATAGLTTEGPRHPPHAGDAVCFEVRLPRSRDPGQPLAPPQVKSPST